MLGRSSVIARNFSQSMVRFSGHGGVPGEVSSELNAGIVWLHNFCLALANPDGKSIIYYEHHNFPLQNLPFSLQNKYRITALFTIGCVLGFGSPFLIVRHQLLKK